MCVCFDVGGVLNDVFECIVCVIVVGVDNVLCFVGCVYVKFYVV